MKGKVLFVSGIDTSVGKTVATGLLAKALMVAGKRVITQKMIQTGCVNRFHGRGQGGLDLSLYLHISLFAPHGGGKGWP